MSRRGIAQACWLILPLALCPFALGQERAHHGAKKGTSEAAEGVATDDDQENAAEELAPPRARASVIGPNPSYLGQMVQVEVELLRDSSAPEQPAAFFPEVRMRGAIVILSESAPPPELRAEDGVEFLVQKRRYLVFPQSPGRLTVPPVPISLPAPEGRRLDVSTEPLELHADVPKGAGRRLPLVARKVSLEREIEGDLDSLRVGDAVTVSLRTSAEDTDALLLPHAMLPEIEGLSRYPGESTSRTTSSRGVYRAERVDRATYVASAWGFSELPQQSILWLDPTTGEYHEATAPALSFRVRVNPGLKSGCLGDPAATGRIGATFGAVLLALAVVLRGVRAFAGWRRRRVRVDRSAGERVAYGDLVRAAHAGRDAPTLTALYRWLRFADRSVWTLEDFRTIAKDPGITATTRELEARVATGSGKGAPGDLLRPVSRFRKEARRVEQGSPPLPPLNET